MNVQNVFRSTKRLAMGTLAIWLLAGCFQKRESVEMNLDTTGVVGAELGIEMAPEPIKPFGKTSTESSAMSQSYTQKMRRARQYFNSKKYTAARSLFEELYQENPSLATLDLIKSCDAHLEDEAVVNYQHELIPSFPKEWTYGSDLSFGWKCGLLFADAVEVRLYVGDSKTVALGRRYPGDKESDNVSFSMLKLPEETDFIRWKISVEFEDGYRTRKEGKIKVVRQ